MRVTVQEQDGGVNRMRVGYSDKNFPWGFYWFY